MEVIKGEHPGDVVTNLTSTSTEQVELKDLLDIDYHFHSMKPKKVLTLTLNLLWYID